MSIAPMTAMVDPKTISLSKHIAFEVVHRYLICIVRASSTLKASENVVKEQPHKSHGSSSLPSNWDRYKDEDEDDIITESQIHGQSSKQSNVVLSKSKGADYAYLISEAKSQNSTRFSSEIFPSLDDFVYSKGKDSFLVVRGESLLSSIQNDSFFVDDKTPANYEHKEVFKL
ncbi:unnamed protein product [Lactuca virosa]|uniref:Uncharacterized protein n=1 Tax=Lactuca virosa TaxID=75947 RepID=A0AAU9MW76_9ASTR|nr:unnamed protein product [Lactuca virosa]